MKKIGITQNANYQGVLVELTESEWALIQKLHHVCSGQQIDFATDYQRHDLGIGTSVPIDQWVGAVIHFVENRNWLLRIQETIDDTLNEMCKNEKLKA